MAIAIAEKFASEGYAVQLAARNSSRLFPLQSDLAIKYGSKVSLHEFNAVAFDTHAQFFEELYVKPEVTVCVFGHMNDNEKVMDDWSMTENTINANYTGAVSILNIVARYYASQEKGAIVGISSVAGERGRQTNFIYGSAKAGFTAYLSGLRNYLFHKNVHVVTVLPGFVYTKMTENLQLPALLTAKPSDVAEAVYKAVVRRKNIIYIKWFWRYIMLVIKSIPEPLFKRMKL